MLSTAGFKLKFLIMVDTLLVISPILYHLLKGMKIFSFITHNYELIPGEVEIILIRGMLTVHFMGLPDTAIKESVTTAS